MRRQIAPSDIAATFRTMRQVRALDPDILHAHGAKGGVYARVIGTLLRASGVRVARIYSPHGGSLHYDVRDGFYEYPALATRVLDRVGAGDGVLATTSLLVQCGAPWDIIGFLGNVAGAELVAELGNRVPLDRVTLSKHVTALMK